MEYSVYELPLTLTNNDISSIITSYRARACTVKETSSDSRGNSYDVFLILQGYTKQYAIVPKVDDVKTVLKNALIRVGTASGVASLNEDKVNAAVENASEVSTDDIEGPWKDVSAEWELLQSCLDELSRVKAKLSNIKTCYLMVIKADKTPESSVIAIPKSYPPIDEVSAKVAELSSLPSDIAGYDVIAITGGLSDEEVNNLLMMNVAKVVFNSLDCYDKVFQLPKPYVRVITANYLQYNTELGAEVIEFIDLNGVQMMAVEEEKLSDDLVVLVKAITPEGEEFPVVFGCNVRGYPIIWNLAGFGVTNDANLPSSYNDSEVIKRVIKIYNMCINIIPKLGWGPLEERVKNIVRE